MDYFIYVAKKGCFRICKTLFSHDAAQMFIQFFVMILQNFKYLLKKSNLLCSWNHEKKSGLVQSTRKLCTKHDVFMIR